MTIGEAARASGLSTYTIRYYEQTGVVGEPERNANGRRTYSQQHVARLRCVAALRRSGMPIAEMRKVVTELQGFLVAPQDAINSAAVERCIALLEVHKQRLASDALEIETLMRVTEATVEAFARSECPSSAVSSEASDAQGQLAHERSEIRCAAPVASAEPLGEHRHVGAGQRSGAIGREAGRAFKNV